VSRTPTLAPSEPFVVVYDLQDPDAWTRAHRHRNFWGKLYTDIATLDNDHVALTFNPAPGVRWRPWEEVRKTWILKEVA
jgi:hypothetical protein